VPLDSDHRQGGCVNPPCATFGDRRSIGAQSRRRPAGVTSCLSRAVQSGDGWCSDARNTDSFRMMRTSTSVPCGVMLRAVQDRPRYAGRSTLSPDRRMKFFAAALGHLVVILAVGTEPSAATSQSNDSQLAVFARPLGVWCDGIARFTVGLSNPGPDRLVVGVPRRPDTRFPYKSTGTLSFNEKAGTGWGGACGCSAGVDCELCATPDIRVTLGAGEELTWTMEIANMEISVGPASLRLTLHWYGGRFRVGGALQKMSGTTGQELSVAGVDDRCFVASAVAKKAG
jgi:hypothetical protein